MPFRRRSKPEELKTDYKAPFKTPQRLQEIDTLTADCADMWVQAAILAPCSGLSPCALLRRSINAGISCSAISISRRPKSACLTFRIQKSRKPVKVC